jgi:hypothetical protein
MSLWAEPVIEGDRVVLRILAPEEVAPVSQALIDNASLLTFERFRDTMERDIFQAMGVPHDTAAERAPRSHLLDAANYSLISQSAHDQAVREAATRRTAYVENPDGTLSPTDPPPDTYERARRYLRVLFYDERNPSEHKTERFRRVHGRPVRFKRLLLTAPDGSKAIRLLPL